MTKRSGREYGISDGEEIYNKILAAVSIKIVAGETNKNRTRGVQWGSEIFYCVYKMVTNGQRELRRTSFFDKSKFM